MVIGAGHNGLATALRLARAGWRVAVVERRATVGGCATTEELWPGFRISTAAYVLSLFPRWLIEKFRLRQFGLEVLPRDPASITPLPDGRVLLLGHDPARNQQQVARFSPHDAEQLPRYEALLEQVARGLEPLLEQVAPDPLPLPPSWRRRGWGKRLRDLGTLHTLWQALGELGPLVPQAVRLLAGTALPFLQQFFHSEVLLATLATDAVIGSCTPADAPGSAYVLLHHVMGTAGGARGRWGYVRGGMGGLSQALARAAQARGVRVLLESPARRILVERGRCCGVELADGTVLAAPVVASSLDPNWTFLRLLEKDLLPEKFRQAVQAIDYRSASAKINVALSRLPRLEALARLKDPLPPAGTIHLCPDVEYLLRANEGCPRGQMSREPVLEITIPSVVDDTLAPRDAHVMNIFVQYAPYELAGGWTPEAKEELWQRCLGVLNRYFPDFEQAVLHRQVLSPADLEQTFGLTGGNIFQGAMTPEQLFFLRPVPGWADHRTPVPGLYLCGAAAHPGGGVLGLCGYNAAGEILRDWPAV